MNNSILQSLKIIYEQTNYIDIEYNRIEFFKMLLFCQNIDDDKINIILKNFYNSIGKEINIDVFEKIKIKMKIKCNCISCNKDNNDDDKEDDNIKYITFREYIILKCIWDMYYVNEDIIFILDEKDKNKLEKNILENDFEDKCLICYDLMNIGQEVINLPCKHTYHTECIDQYLSKYNYKCPCCKLEVGKPVLYV